MKFVDFFNILHAGYGAGEAKHKFLYTFMKEIVTNPELLNYNKNTYRAYTSGKRNPKKFLQNIINYITDKNLMSYFDEISNDQNTANQLIKSLHDNGYDCELDDLSIVLFDMFKAMIEQTIYGAIEGNARIKETVEQIQTLWNDMFRVGLAISNNPSQIDKMFGLNEIGRLRSEMETLISEFKKANEQLIKFKDRIEETEQLYLLSVTITPNMFENIFNINTAVEKYDKLLRNIKYILADTH